MGSSTWGYASSHLVIVMDNVILKKGDQNEAVNKILNNVKTQVSSKKRKKDSSKTELKKKRCEAPTLVPANIDDLLGEDEDEPGSIENGNDALEWMISPTSLQDFFKDYWEKKPLHI